MNIIDSSAWLEYFADTRNARNFAKIIEKTRSLLVPSIILYEVFKKIRLERDEATALRIVAHMKLGIVIALDTEIALRAAELSIKHAIPMADSIILATSQKYSATIWTQDADFKDLPRVRYFPKR